MDLFKKIADNSLGTSLAHSMRFKRFKYFIELISNLERPMTILDIGGTQEYWSRMGFNDSNIKVTLLNLSEQVTTSPNFSNVVGNATNLSVYNDAHFDIVYSNSVIEHLFTKENQMKMANEVRRVGKYYFIQTPNYFFLIEPHFLFPGFQFLPYSLKVWLVNNFSLGHIKKKKSVAEAKTQIEEIKLLTTKEMKTLFPDSTIWKEKVAGFTKSIIAHNFAMN